MAITLPELQLRHAEQMAAAEGYESVDIYLAHLIDVERERKLAELRAMIAEGDADIARGDVFEINAEEMARLAAECEAEEAARS